MRHPSQCDDASTDFLVGDIGDEDVGAGHPHGNADAAYELQHEELDVAIDEHFDECCDRPKACAGDHKRFATPSIAHEAGDGRCYKDGNSVEGQDEGHQKDVLFKGVCKKRPTQVLSTAARTPKEERNKDRQRAFGEDSGFGGLFWLSGTQSRASIRRYRSLSLLCRTYTRVITSKDFEQQMNLKRLIEYAETVGDRLDAAAVATLSGDTQGAQKLFGSAQAVFCEAKSSFKSPEFEELVRIHFQAVPQRCDRASF